MRALAARVLEQPNRGQEASREQSRRDRGVDHAPRALQASSGGDPPGVPNRLIGQLRLEANSLTLPGCYRSKGENGMTQNEAAPTKVEVLLRSQPRQGAEWRLAY